MSPDAIHLIIGLLKALLATIVIEELFAMINQYSLLSPDMLTLVKLLLPATSFCNDDGNVGIDVNLLLLIFNDANAVHPLMLSEVSALELQLMSVNKVLLFTLSVLRLER